MVWIEGVLLSNLHNTNMGARCLHKQKPKPELKAQLLRQIGRGVHDQVQLIPRLEFELAG